MPEIITGATARKEFDEYSLYNKTVCECGALITRENVVMAENEKTLLDRDVLTVEFFCSVHCANEKIDKS